METKISLIVPMYNSEKTIENCLMSLFNQTLKEIEIIVVNDGSSDNSLNIAEKYKDKIKIITIKNSGQGLARNEGMKIAKGEYIGFVDSDDIVDPTMYEKMYALGKDCDMVQCAIKDVYKNKESVRPVIEENIKIEIDDSYTYIENYFYKMIHTNEVCNKIFKKEFLIKNNLFFEDTKEIFSEDLLLNIMSLEKLSSVFYIKEPLYIYNISDSGHCNTKTCERLFKILKLYKKATDNITSPFIKNLIKSTAVVTIMSYAVPVINEKETKEFMKKDEIKDFIKASKKYKKTFKHSLLMNALLYLPWFIKKKIIEKYYIFK